MTPGNYMMMMDDDPCHVLHYELTHLSSFKDFPVKHIHLTLIPLQPLGRVDTGS